VSKKFGWKLSIDCKAGSELGFKLVSKKFGWKLSIDCRAGSDGYMDGWMRGKSWFKRLLSAVQKIILSLKFWEIHS
jgi:hypothetical protein